jgi:hypothetical protein
MSLAVIWHYWIGVVLAVSVIGLIASTIAGYFTKVVRLKHPPRR